MSRRALIRRRCSGCGGTVSDKTCPKGHRRWTWSFTVDTNPPGAPRRQLTRSGFKTKADAQQALAELQVAVARSEFVGPTRLTVSEYIEDHWLPSVQARLRPSTLESYRIHLRNHAIPKLGSIRLQALQTSDLNAVYGQLRVQSRINGKGPLSPRTVRYLHAILRKALQDAVRWNLLVRNVADLADPPSATWPASRVMTTWSAEQLRTFLHHVRDDRLAAMWVLFATTGMRRGEVVGLRWIDIDLEHGRLSVTRTRITIGHRVVDSEPKTRRSRRQIALDAGTVAALRDWRRRQLEERLLCGAGWTDSGLVFTLPDGRPLHPDSVSGTFVRLCAEAALLRIRLHDLRHTWATLALQQGVPLKVVSERLGHSGITITADTYQHVTEGMDRDAADRVAALVFDKSP